MSDAGETSSSLVTIDSLGLRQLSVLQLDVEGAELSALRGATATIEATRPVVMIEDNKRNCQSFMGEMRYVPVAEIPGLRIWTPNEKADTGTAVTDFLKSARVDG